MVSNISFGSTYKVSSKNNSYKQIGEFQKFALEKEMDIMLRGQNSGAFSLTTKDETENEYPYFSTEHTLVAPDNLDKEIETFCAINGINFSKRTTDDLMKPYEVLSRIEEPKKGMRQVKVNVEKLENLIADQQTNLRHCENDYDFYYKDHVEAMLKSGKRFPTTSLYIINQDNPASFEDAVEYIKKYGADRLNSEQFYIGFDQRTTSPDQCVYFALRDMGMKNVPVYVNNGTYQIGKALELFK